MRGIFFNTEKQSCTEEFKHSSLLTSYIPTSYLPKSSIHFFSQSFYPWVFQVFVKSGKAVYDAFGG